MIRITMPYKRQCFNPEVARYLQAVEAHLNAREQEIRSAATQAFQDLMREGTASIRRE